MQTELISLSKAFTENLYRIPDYQRGYSWGEKQLKDFWNDVQQLEEKRNHYVGVLTLEAAPKSATDTWEDDSWIIEAKHYRPYFVVDGQQRLTTVIILIQSILEKTESGQTLNYDTKEEVQKRYIFLSKDEGISRSYIFGYEKDNPSYEFLKTVIFQEQSDHHAVSEETIYTQNLAKAKEFFSEKIKDFSPSEIEKLYTKVTQNLLFNVFTIREDIDVFVTFETMNNRGKPLSHLELLKNRLIYLSTKFTDADGEHKHERTKLRRTINECWKTAYHYLGKNKKKPLDDNFFLTVQFLLYFNRKLPKTDYASDDGKIGLSGYAHHGRYKDYLLDEFFTARRVGAAKSDNPLTVEAIYAYAKDLKQTVKIYYELFDPGSTRLSSQEKIYLDRLTRMASYHTLMILTAVYKCSVPPAVRLEFLKELERFSFFKSIRFHQDMTGVELDEDAVRLIDNSKDLASVTKDLSERNKKFASSNEFKIGLVELGKRAGYYGWSALRYFLYEYEQYLRGQAKTSREKLDWEEFSKENFKSDFVTIEHIYPQRAAHNTWKVAFDGLGITHKNTLKHSLGNLVPLSAPKNSSLGNRPFVEKKGSAEKKVGFSYGCYSENEIAHESDWTPSHILKRGVRLLSFMEERWNVELGDDSAKAAVLGLDFLLPKASEKKSARRKPKTGGLKGKS